MELELTDRSKRLLELLWTIPPQFEEAKAYLDANQLSADEVTRVANIYADKCSRDLDDYIGERCPDDCTMRDVPIPQGIISKIPSGHIYGVVALLLQYGLDPNVVYEADGRTYNIMRLIMSIDNEYIAADTMRLLLDNGGDPNLTAGIETIFECIDYDVWFGSVEQEIRWRYDAWVHVWMVLLAYGGEIPGKGQMMEAFRERHSDDLFDLKKLRNHRDYFFGLSVENKGRTMHIFDKKTFWEVARW